MKTLTKSSLQLLSWAGLATLTCFASANTQQQQQQQQEQQHPKQVPDPSCQWTPSPLQRTLQNPDQICFSPAAQSSHVDDSKESLQEKLRLLGWDGPHDCHPTTPDYCIYSKLPADESGGKGFIVISTTKSMSAISDTPPLPDEEAKSLPAIDPSSYYESEIPGKGIGLIANRTIRTGEIIMRRLPTLLIQFDVPELDSLPGSGNKANELPLDQRLDMYEKAVRRMDDKTRELFNRQMGKDAVEKVDKNSFRMFVAGNEGHLACYPDVSRFNHDCRPK